MDQRGDFVTAMRIPETVSIDGGWLFEKIAKQPVDVIASWCPCSSNRTFRGAGPRSPR
jgi:hypothetical protein